MGSISEFKDGKKEFRLSYKDAFGVIKYVSMLPPTPTTTTEIEKAYVFTENEMWIVPLLIHHLVWDKKGLTYDSFNYPPKV